MSIKYPYTDFHEMNLDWTMKTVKNAEEQSADAVEKAEQAVQKSEQTEEYVNTYFENLDVQDEVNNILDQMATDGTLGGLIDNIIGNTLNPVVVSSVSDMTDVNITYVLSSDAHVYQYDTGLSAFYDTSIVYGAGIGNVVTYNGITQAALSSLAVQSVYLVASPLPSDAPSSVVGFCFTYGSTTQKMQIYIEWATGTWYFRRYSGGVWQAWNGRDNNSVQYWGTFSNTGNLNNMSPNNIRLVSDGTNLVNGPGVSGAAFIFNYGDPGTDTMIQIYTVFATGERYYRRKVTGTWYAWEYLDDKTNLFKYAGQNLSDCNAASAMSVYIIGNASSVANCPVSSGAGYLFTYGTDSTARIQFYKTFTGSDIYYRRSSGNSYTAWEVILSDNTVGNENAKMLSVGNSILTGSVWTSGAFDHLCAYDNAPYGVIADAMHILRGNVTHRLMDSAGLLYDAGEGNFLNTIKGINTNDYDVVMTHLWTQDMVNFQLGTINSVAGDGSIAGAVKELVNYLKSVNGRTQLVLIGVPPASTIISGASVFTGVYNNGHSLAECEALMQQLADQLHFTFVGWQDLNLSYYYQDFTDGTNVHANSESVYRTMGGYLGARVSRNINF